MAQKVKLFTRKHLARHRRAQAAEKKERERQERAFDEFVAELSFKGDYAMRGCKE